MRPRRIHAAADMPIRTATAATRAAPRPLPSSDSIKSNCKERNKIYLVVGSIVRWQLELQWRFRKLLNI